jgi:hypothetical protein
LCFHAMRRRGKQSLARPVRPRALGIEIRTGGGVLAAIALLQILTADLYLRDPSVVGGKVKRSRPLRMPPWWWVFLDRLRERVGRRLPPNLLGRSFQLSKCVDVCAENSNCLFVRRALTRLHIASRTFFIENDFQQS